MAGVQQRRGSYRVYFRYQGKQHTFKLGEVSSEEAKNKARQVEYLLMRLNQGLAKLPTGIGIAEYVQFDGQPPAAAAEAPSPPPAPPARR